jgi:hypothetical protein
MDLLGDDPKKSKGASRARVWLRRWARRGWKGDRLSATHCRRLRLHLAMARKEMRQGKEKLSMLKPLSASLSRKGGRMGAER